MANYEAALKDADMAIQLDPNEERDYGFRCAIFMDLKLYDSALNDINKSIQLFNISETKTKEILSDRYVSRARAYYYLKKYDLSIQDIQTANQIDSREMIGREILLALNYHHLGNKEEALKCIEGLQHISLWPYDCDLYSQLYLHLKDFANALVHLEQFNKVATSQQHKAKVHLYFGLMHFLQGNNTQGINEICSAAKIDPKSILATLIDRGKLVISNVVTHFSNRL